MSLKVTAQLGNDTRDIRSRGMDMHQLKQRIDASGKKLVTLGNEYIKSKDGVSEILPT